MAKHNNSGLIAISSVVVYTAIGIAVWWKTTEISRPLIPLELMWDASKLVASAQPALPVWFTFYAQADGMVEDPGRCMRGWRHGWARSMHESMALHMGLSPETAAEKLSVQLIIQDPSGECTHHNVGPTNHNTSALCLQLKPPPLEGNPKEVDEYIHSTLEMQGASLPGSYMLFMLPSPSAPSPPAPEAPLVMGQHRHAWITYPSPPSPPSRSTSPSSRPPVSSLRAAMASVEAETIISAFHLRSGSSKAQLPLSAAGQLQLSFSLCNADPTTAAFSWDFDSLEARYLRPLVGVLGPVADVSISSQILHYTVSAIDPQWNHDESAYVITHQQLPYFVDSHWSLESEGVAVADNKGRGEERDPPGASKSRSDASMHIPPHLLHFVVYIPPPEHRPLRLQLRNGSLSPTNSFWIPSWGGVIILDPDQITGSDQVRQPDQRAAGSAPPPQPSPESDGDSEPAAGAADSGIASDSDTSPDSSSDSSRPPDSESTPGTAAIRADIGAGGMHLLPPSTLHHISQIVVSQLHSHFGLPSFKPLPPPHNHHAPSQQDTPPVADSTTDSDLKEGATNADPARDEKKARKNRDFERTWKLRVSHLPAESTGLATWQLEALLRQRTTANLAAAAQMLSSLATAVRDLPNLEMPDLIGTHVKQALGDLLSAAVAAEKGMYHAAGAGAQSARTHAQSAYLHPAVLAQLNFPESHKLGIYVPYFMPAGVAVLRGLVKEVMAWKQKRRGI